VRNGTDCANGQVKTSTAEEAELQLAEHPVEERTADIYERIAAYPRPPLAPLPPLDEIDILGHFGVKDTLLGRAVVKTGMRLAGFNRFYKDLPQNLETLMRRSNLRGAGLFSLVNSATLALADDPRQPDALDRAVSLILAARELYVDLSTGKLPPDRYRDQVLEMGQYPNLFSTALTVEGRVARLFKSKKRSQLAVLVGGRIYLLEIGEPEQDLEPAALREALERIVQSAREKGFLPVDRGVGVLTSAKHTTQLRVFGQLQQDPTNREALRAIRHSFVTLCLDLDDEPDSVVEAARLAQSQNLHNRWQHASLQFVVFGNGKACTLCNFNAYVDGNPMMRGSAELQRRAARMPLASASQATGHLPEAVELEWHVPDKLIDLALRDVEWVRDSQQATFEIPGVGKKNFENSGVAPVSGFVLAVQTAAKELIGDHASVLQYLTMSKYCCMGLANADATTPEAKRFVDTFLAGATDREQALQLLREADASQRQAYRQARRYLPFSDVLSLFMSTRKGLGRAYVTALLGLSMFGLRLLGQIDRKDVEIVLSHPEIFPEVPVVGRPGIRLPYVRYFGLHYQILDDKTVVTYMPSVGWKVPNKELHEKLSRAFEEIAALAGSAGRDSGGEPSESRNRLRVA